MWLQYLINKHMYLGSVKYSTESSLKQALHQPEQFIDFCFLQALQGNFRGNCKTSMCTTQTSASAEAHLAAFHDVTGQP